MTRSVVRSSSYGSVKVFWLDSQEAVARLRSAAEGLIEQRPELVGVYLFGSLAEGRAVPGSDADLLIVLNHSDRRWLDRPLDYLPAFDDVGLPVEVFCYTADEVDRVPLARRARERSTVLAER